MQVYNYTQYSNYNRYNTYSDKRPQFKAVRSLQASTIKVERGFEYSFRILRNKFSDLFQSKKSKEITRNIAALTPKQDKVFLAQLAEIGRLYATKKVIDVNIEDKILEQIAKTGDSTIFIMNHSNQTEDPQLLAVLNILLAEAYKKASVEQFPLPKIILNEDILKTMNPTKRKAFENFGAVGIDASITGGDKSSNAKAFFPLIKDFVRNKCNIFIFPEGRLAVRKDLDLHGRFQTGVANMINKILGVKKEVTVVPVGFAYGKGEQKDLTAMNIGTPIFVKRIGETTTVTKGDIEKKSDSCLYNFFEKHKEETDIAITSGGKPVPQNNIAEYLKTILCENLDINSNIAEKKLQTPFIEEDIKLV